MRNGWTWAHAARAAVDRVETLLRRPARPALDVADALDEFGDDDAMLGELFARLRVVDPTLVEIGPPSAALRTSLIERWGWRASNGDDAPDGFDLLAAERPADVEAAWTLAVARRPRVVRLPAASATPADGYALLAAPSGLHALYVREDVLGACDFAVLADAMPRRRRVW